MYLISFYGDLIKSEIIVMAKFEGKDINSTSFYELLRSKDFLKILKEPEYIDFWYKLVEQIPDDISLEFEDEIISDFYFDKIWYYIQLHEIDVKNLLFYNYSKDMGNCCAVIEDDNLLDIIRTCSDLLIEKNYPIFYF